MSRQTLIYDPLTKYKNNSCVYSNSWLDRRKQKTFNKNLMLFKLFIGNVLPLMSDAWDSARHVHLPHESLNKSKNRPRDLQQTE